MAKRYMAFDVGHGGSDPGAVNGKRKEADDVLKLTKAVEKYIEKASGGKWDCQKSRTEDKTLSLKQRSDWQKRHPEYEFFVSFHRDSAGSSARGASVHIYNGQMNKASGKLAKCVAKRLCPILPGRSNTIQEHNFHVLRETSCPAILIECGFISNSTDNKIFDSKFDEIVKAIAEGIMEYAGIKKVSKPVSKPSKPAEKPSKPTPKPPAKPGAKVYRVIVDGKQIGAFKDIENMKEEVQKAVQAGKKDIKVERVD